MSSSSDFRSGLERRDEFMARVPSWYRGQWHFVAVNLVGIVLIGLAALGIHRLRAVELVTIPVAFFIANFFEWWVHKGPLHHQARGPAGELYKRHTLLHHASFSSTSMAVRSARELRMVLFPFPAILGAALIATGLAALVTLLTTVNAGRLTFAVALGYYLLYEWCHLSFHLPETSWLGRNPITRALRGTHTRHHDPARMLSCNFNVTFPIVDALMGTLDREEKKSG